MRRNSVIGRIRPGRRALLLAVAGAMAVPVIAPTSATAATTGLTETSTASTLSAGSTATTTVSAPPAPAGAVTASLVQSFNPALVKLTSAADVKAPKGWTLDYSTDGTTYSSTAPADLSTVTSVKATGSVTSSGVAGGMQLTSQSSSISGTTVSVPPVLASAGTGDGWMPIFTGGSARVFNLHHHLAPGASTFDCHSLSTGAYCPGFPYITQMNVQQRAVATVVNNKLWTPGYNWPSKVAGFWCYSLAAVATGGTPTPCAVPWVPLSTHVSPGAQPGDVWDIFNSIITTSGWDINYGSTTDLKIFGIDKLTGNLLCLDTAKAARCAGQPVDGWNIGLPAGTWPFTTANSFSSVQVWGDQLYALTGNSSPWSTMTCRLVSAPSQLCPGWTGPVARADSAILVRLPDATGNIIGVCRMVFASADTCWNATGGTFTPPSSINYRSTAVIADASRMTNALPVTRGSRIYWQTISPVSPNLRCWDAALNNGLGGQCTVSKPAGISFGAYAAAPHPAYPDCVIGAQDTQPTMLSIDIRNGVLGCDKAIPSSVTMPASSLLPPLGCDSQASMADAKWKSYALSATSQPYVSAVLSVKDAAGNYVTSAGKLWREIPFPASGVIDLSGLLVADSGTNPTFLVDFYGVPNGKSMTGSGTLTVEGPPPALCLTLTAIAACPQDQGTQVSGALPANVATITGSGESRSATGAADSFNSATTTITIPPASSAQCLGTLEGTAFLDGSTTPVPNAPVSLLDANGKPVVGADGKPVTAITDANGHYSFPGLVAGDYTVTFAGSPLYDPLSASASGVKATVPAGGTATANGQYTSPPPGTLSGTATENGTGAPIPNAPVRLLDAKGNPVLGPDGQPITTTTGPDGTYSFGTLTPGTYQVAFGAAGTETPTSPSASGVPATVTSGGAAVANGLYDPPPPGAIIGTADIVGRALVSGTTQPMAGATVTLLDATGKPVLDAQGELITTTTAANGTYSFPNVPPGNYRVGFASTSTADVTSATAQVPVTVPSGGTGIADGEYLINVGSLAGKATLQGTTTPVVGALVGLFTADGSPVLDASGNPVTATTDANGSYLFPDLQPGPYTVRFADTATAAAVGAAASGVSATVPANGTGIANGTYALPPKGSVSGTAYLDGTITPVPGAPVSLLDANGKPVNGPDGQPLQAITAADGSYSFTNLPAGDYQVAFGAVTPYGQSAQARQAVPVTVPKGGAGIANGPYLPPTGNLAGSAFVDGTTTPVPGATVRLLDAGGKPVLGPDGLPLTAVTDAQGNFSFSALPIGDYVVDFSAAGRYSPLPIVSSGVRATVPANGTGFAPAPYQAPIGALRGTAYLDGTTTPIPGATVRLLDANGNPVLDGSGTPLTAITAADGTYSFTKLPPGAYSVVFGATSDASPTGAALSPVPANVIGGGVATADGPYRQTKPGALRGTAVLDGTTTPVPGAEVTLLDAMGQPVLDASGRPRTAVTAADGTYLFGDLAPGVYQVRFASTSDATVIGSAGTGLLGTVAAGRTTIIDGPYEVPPPKAAPIAPADAVTPPASDEPVLIPVIPPTDVTPPVIVVPETVTIVAPGESAWSQVIAQPEGTWEVRGTKVEFTPAPQFRGTATITVAATTSSGVSIVRPITVVVARKHPKPTGDVPSVVLAGRSAQIRRS